MCTSSANLNVIESCALGTVGPGGGVVFYDAGKLEWWGRYLEAAVLRTQVGTTWSSPANSQTSLYSGDAATIQRQRIDAKAIGMGLMNTELIIKQSGPGAYAAMRAAKFDKNGLDDWFLPSKDELNEFYNYRATRTGSVEPIDGPVWSSTEAWKNIAWYQLFQDGTQFSD
ncbi:MAG: hypothetical protein KGQ43_02330, partial [Acidobacteria bacterium]|nr:hypothetical protein [Acidobacteriota bacterium]